MNTSAHDIEERVRALGRDFDLDVLAATAAIYRPLVDSTPVNEQRDVAYGPHARHRLDVYLPDGRPRGVVVYVHGGGFVRGEKDADGVFYPNVGRFLARAGFAAVLPNYRRAGEAGWPAGAQDVQRTVEWVQAGGVVLGMERAAGIFVMGQSAGASHVASWFFDRHARAAPLPEVQGVLMMSGYYRAAAPLAANISAYFGEDASQYAQRSPLTHVSQTAVPVWLSVAELDPGRIATHSYELAQALTGCNGRSPEFAWFKGHNHVSTVFSLGSPQADAGAAILDFLGRHARQLPASLDHHDEPIAVETGR
jgi:acetyl esterase/lipase